MVSFVMFASLTQISKQEHWWKPTGVQVIAKQEAAQGATLASSQAVPQSALLLKFLRSSPTESK